jgi:hypothetical protein
MVGVAADIQQSSLIEALIGELTRYEHDLNVELGWDVDDSWLLIDIHSFDGVSNPIIVIRLLAHGDEAQKHFATEYSLRATRDGSMAVGQIILASDDIHTILSDPNLKGVYERAKDKAVAKLDEDAEVDVDAVMGMVTGLFEDVFGPEKNEEETNE